ncbi:MAG: hypothetical protein IJY36_02240 [Coprobacter sp.]|nr:hypothetical protein [Coprobacter sp.]
MKQEIHLSEHFTFRKLMQFTFPSIVMMVFTSIYGVVDGIWLAVTCTEVWALLVSVTFLFYLRPRYRY